MITVREFVTNDATAMGEVFYRAVHEGTRAFYDAAQRQAWAPRIPAGDEWLRRLEAAETFVARRHGQVVGFMSLRPDGYLDLAYVTPEEAGQGTARTLYESLERRARELHCHRLKTDASELARRFFLKLGWAVAERQEITRQGVALTNYAMEKQLPNG